MNNLELIVNNLITDDVIEDILITVCESGFSNGWIESANINYKTAAAGNSSAVFTYEDPYEEGHITNLVSRNNIRDAIVKYLLTRAIEATLDAEDADSILQYAFFDGIIFG